MNTSDKAEEVVEVKKRGRPAKKVDPATPLGSYIAAEAKEARKKAKDPVVNKYYELQGKKLILCKVIASGSVYKTLIGTTDDAKHGPQLKIFIDKLNKEGRLKIKV